MLARDSRPKFVTKSFEAPPPSEAPRSNNPLFEALVCETHHAALMTAVVTSAINGSVSSMRPFERAFVDRYMPVEPAVLLKLARSSLLDVNPLVETSTAIDDFFTSLCEARGMLERYLREHGELGAGRALQANGYGLTRAWRWACHESLRAIRQLELEIPGRISDVYCAHAHALGKLLLAAESGGVPCLDFSGRPFIPAMPQRRRSNRRSIAQFCRVTVEGTLLSGFVKDLSEGGMGLLRVPYLRTEDQISVELQSGRRFVGKVVWVMGDSAGVKFVEPLKPEDPLLSFHWA